MLREPAKVAAHIETLVRNSRELMLIDPHFDPSVSRWRPVVQACFALAAQAVHGTLRLEIHTLAGRTRRSTTVRDEPSREEFERRCRSHVPGMLPVPVTSVRICRWRIRGDAPDDFHGRYVVTDRGGYRLDKGLDLERGKAQPIGLLAAQEWRRIRDGFRDTNSFFDKDGEFTVSESRSASPRSVG